jgi:hypothetical protein
MPARIVLGRHLELQARITVDEAGRATFGGDEGTLEIATSDLPETASIDERVAAIVERVRAQVVPAAIEVDDAR